MMTDTETDWVALIGPEPIFIERRGNVMIYLDMEDSFGANVPGVMP